MMPSRVLTVLGLCLGLVFDVGAAETPRDSVPLIDSHGGSWTVAHILHKAPHGAGHQYQGKSCGWEGINGPTDLEFYVYGPGHADLELGMFYLLPMTRKKESWHSLVGPTGPIELTRKVTRPALAFIRNWVINAHQPPRDRLDEWLGLLIHPFKFARETASFRLIQGAALFSSKMGDSRLNRLGAPLLEPEFGLKDRKRTIKVFAAIGSAGGAAWLAEHWDLLRPAPVQRAAAGVMAAHPSRATIRVLRRCSNSSARSVKGRCQQLIRQLLRASNGPPSAIGQPRTE